MFNLKKEKVFSILLVLVPLVVAVKHAMDKNYYDSALWCLIAVIYLVRNINRYLKSSRKEKKND